MAHECTAHRINRLCENGTIRNAYLGDAEI